MDIDDRLSIKNVLFTRSHPVLEIPACVSKDQKIFPCIDCGDKFVFENSYDYHVNRQSMQITFMCRFCNATKIFYNRCKLLFHIRSHAFKTATINVNDLKVEPLPDSFFKMDLVEKRNPSPKPTDNQKKSNMCYECKLNISPSTGMAYKDRASHYMQYTNEVHSCPICLFALPTACGLRAHLRFHLNFPPFFCSECGVHLPTKNVQYPYSHDCEGFKMMRATARLKCLVANCHLFHPNELKDHMKEKHLKKVYKCPVCVVACFNEATMNTHLQEHNPGEWKALIFYQCELCPGKLVVQSNMENHLRTHTNEPVYPCWSCGITCKSASTLLEHHLHNHGSNVSIPIKNMLKTIRTKELEQQGNVQRTYRVVKRCDQCKRNFTYKCNYSEISVLPNECPYKCTSTMESNVTTLDTDTQLSCHLCKEKISYNWEEIKKHYAKNHKTHKCLDTKVVLERIDVTNYKKNNKRTSNRGSKKVGVGKTDDASKIKKTHDHSPKPLTTDLKDSEILCPICQVAHDSKVDLEKHFLSHKDPCMAYQCMECGKNFVVKPSFTIHLMIEHDISNVDEYILNKSHCYNENAFEKFQGSTKSFEPFKENQCKICREQFNTSEDLSKHFRGHGMAFLLKNASNKNNS